MTRNTANVDMDTFFARVSCNYSKILYSFNGYEIIYKRTPNNLNYNNNGAEQ